MVRDVTALDITVVVVALNLERGEVGVQTSAFFITLYVVFVLIVLVADVYHRAVMLPRIRHETDLKEHMHDNWRRNVWHPNVLWEEEEEEDQLQWLLREQMVLLQMTRRMLLLPRQQT